MSRVVLVLFLIAFLSSFAPAASVWQDVSENSIGAVSSQRLIIPSRYRALRLNKTALEAILRTAPMEFIQSARSSNVILTLPMPDGTEQRFRIEESPIMEYPLAARFPEIKTYRGQGFDDPTATVRFDLTPLGFHAMILSAAGTTFVDPYRMGDVEHYISYRKQDHFRPDKKFRCLVDETISGSNSFRTVAPAVSSGTTLRSYRLALAATGEYTQFHGGTVPLALAAINTSMNRINGIYERELAIRMILVANNNSIIYTNGTTDPYSNGEEFEMLVQNQNTLDAVIGSANYDIGHVFGTGGGGVAGGGVCSNGGKARGVTCRSTPSGDSFDVDFVAHEMGHQFDGSHSFNGTTGNCGNNRNGGAAMEPGSGSTIMAYAGICSSENLQPHSDDYFHAINFDEIISYTTGSGFGNTCDVETSISNTPPSVDAGSNFTIPSKTPFTLTASANDSDGDALTYCWEEFDLGAPAPPNTDNGNRPIFRSFNPVTSPSRTFPKLSNILNNTTTLGESLPTTNRTMNFRATVRDNHANGGGVNYDSMQVISVSSAGPFAVTQPNAAMTWTKGSLQTVLWDVAGTSGAPIQTANVKILLSTDGGNTFPIVLRATTPNDGSETITVPNVGSTQCRVKIQAIGNIFFDISNANFTMENGGGGTCLFCDEFDNSATDPNWIYNPVSGWSEDGQNLMSQSSKKAIAIASPVFDGCSTCTVQASIQTAGGDGNHLRLIGWYQDEKNKIELITKEDVDKWILKQFAGGSLVAKAKGFATILPGTFHNVQIQFDGTNFIVTVDGNVIITMPKASGSSPSGTVGFLVKKTTGTFASISVN